MGATPDGRHKDEFLAHGMNPMPGRNQNGISATANSLCKIDLRHFQGGSLQIELTPIVTQTLGDTARFINHFSRVFFQKHGVQINLNIVDLKELKKAMDDPENPKYQDIVVKVTGYSAHFVAMDRKLQEVRQGAKLSELTAAVMAALNIADDYYKAQEAAESLRGQIREYADEAASLRAENARLKKG